MALSIIEIAVYGFAAYFSLALMLVSIFHQTEINKRLAGLRIAFLTIGVIAAFMLSGSTNEIEFYDITTTTNTNSTIETAVDDGTGTGNLSFFTENVTSSKTTTDSAKIMLQNPMWVMFNIMVGFALIIYIIINTMAILRNPN